MSNKKNRRSSGFNMLELVVVITIIGILAAIAIPRLSRGAAGAADAAVNEDLNVLRNALDVFATEHGGAYPATGTVGNQLTQYTDTTGNVQATKDTTYIYGPYVRKVPTLPVGAAKGNSGIATSAGSGVGWIYTFDGTTARIVTNTTAGEVDARGTAYSNY